MPNTLQTIVQLCREDRRYKFDAYVFVFEALRYGHETLGFGKPQPTEKTEKASRRRSKKAKAADAPPAEEPPAERHLTGQELCEAIRRLALDQYGFMAKTVFHTWGVHSTSDFGEIVFNLIRIGEFSKTDQDRREDFNDVYDFDEALEANYQIRPSVAE